MSILSSDISLTNAPYLCTSMIDTFAAHAVDPEATKRLVSKNTSVNDTPKSLREKICHRLILPAKLSAIAGTERMIAAPLTAIGSCIASYIHSPAGPLSSASFTLTSDFFSYATSRAFTLCLGRGAAQSTSAKIACMAASTFSGMMLTATIANTIDPSFTMYDAALLTATSPVYGSALLNIAGAILG